MPPARAQPAGRPRTATPLRGSPPRHWAAIDKTRTPREKIQIQTQTVQPWSRWMTPPVRPVPDAAAPKPPNRFDARRSGHLGYRLGRPPAVPPHRARSAPSRHNLGRSVQPARPASGGRDAAAVETVVDAVAPTRCHLYSSPSTAHAPYMRSGAVTPSKHNPLRITCCTAKMRLSRALRSRASSTRNLLAL